jgi:glycosyltransferase involved in cell wall biosynthesis
MRVVYLADTQIPSRATNGTQIIRMCSALAARGAEVTLAHPHRFGNTPEGFAGNLWSFYGVPPSFRVVTLPAPLTLRLSGHRRFARVARGLPLALFVLWRSRPRAAPFVFYCRSMIGAWLALAARRMWRGRSSCRGIFLEFHDAPSTNRAWEVASKVDGIITNTDALRDHVTEGLGLDAPPAVTARNGVDVDRLGAVSNTGGPDVRSRLGIDPGDTVVAYSGRLNAEKGIATLLDAWSLIESEGRHLLLIGKAYEDIEERASRLQSVTLTGFVPPGGVAAFTAAADVLVMPTSARIAYADFTCPLKLFEYMASGRPIVCSDLPVLKEVVVDGKNAVLFRADDPRSLADGIERLLSDESLAASLATNARADAREYSWARRAERVVDFIEQRLRDVA